MAGTSAGGNHIAKLLGELGAGARALGIQGAAVASVPFDMFSTTVKMDDDPRIRSLVLDSFLKKAEVKSAKYPGTIDIERVRACTTIFEFSEVFTAPYIGMPSTEKFWCAPPSKVLCQRPSPSHGHCPDWGTRALP